MLALSRHFLQIVNCTTDLEASRGALPCVVAMPGCWTTNLTNHTTHHGSGKTLCWFSFMLGLATAWALHELPHAVGMHHGPWRARGVSLNGKTWLPWPRSLH